jgi:hypothetical protein
VVLILGSTYLLLALMRMAPWSLLNPRTAWPSIACCLSCVIPFVIPMAIFGSAYDFTRIINPPFRPLYQFRPALSYVWDTHWSAVGRKSFGLTVQLDHPMLLLLAAALPGEARPFALGAAAVWMLVSCIAFAPMRTKRIPVDPPAITRLEFSWFREYEPTAARALPTLVLTIEQRWQEAGCSYHADNAADEVPEIHFDVTCSRAAVLPLPVYASPLHMVDVSSHRRKTPCLSMPEFAAICSVVVPTGNSRVSVSLPSMASLPRFGWERAMAMLR